MDILKYFWEEPVHLEALSADTDPDARRRAAPALPLDALLRPTPYYRGYVAGTRLPERRVGCTALARPEAYVRPLLDLFPGVAWTRVRVDGEDEAVADAASVLADPAGTAALVAAAGPLDPAALREVAAAERRYGIPALRRVLAQADLVAFPEPAHDGHDWSLFAPAPLRDRLTEAFRRHPVEGGR
ncbi:MAG: hypothetical protein R3362_07580, partial [Rhodothermales bacterium]|nr:hypothetical protein [Rhodothermales bacterium]